MSYVPSLEDFDSTLPELDPLYRTHYAEMRARLECDGIPVSDYNPRLDEYSRACRAGYLLTYVLRLDGKAVGYSNIYLTHDMHNRDFIASEDTIYVLPGHRGGSGRQLAKFIHDDLKRRGVKRLSVTTSTDLRVHKWLARQGYKHAAHCMTITF